MIFFLKLMKSIQEQQPMKVSIYAILLLTYILKMSID